jgi:hypothetical protein
MGRAWFAAPIPLDHALGNRVPFTTPFMVMLLLVSLTWPGVSSLPE